MADTGIIFRRNSKANLIADPPVVGEIVYALDTEEYGALVSGVLTWRKHIDTVDLETHTSDVNNPHSVTATQVGLGNVDNTSDLNKPISTATQSALDLKYDKTGGSISGSVDITGDITLTGTVDGRDILADGTKLDGIESGATADQTDLEIKTAYENNPDTNAYTDAEKTKVGYISVTQAVDLDTIESRVNSLDTAVVLRGSFDASIGLFPSNTIAGDSYIVSVAGTVDGVDFNINDRIVSIQDNASTTVYTNNWLKLDYTDNVLSVSGKTGAVILNTSDVSESTNLYYTEARVSANIDVAANTAVRHDHTNKTILDNTTASYTVAEETKLASIEDGATADQTPLEIKTAYESNVDTNAFTDSLLSKLNGIEDGAKDDQIASEVPYSNTTSGLTATDVQNAIDEVEGRVDTAETKLATIETNAKDDQIASEVPYTNTTSGLTAINVQAAIDELDSIVDGLVVDNSAAWGSITGTLSNQTDLQNALDAKLDDTQIGVDIQPYSVNLDTVDRIDKVIQTKNILSMTYNGGSNNDKLSVITYTDNYSEEMSYDVNDKLEFVDHLLSSVRQAYTQLAYTAGKLTSVTFFNTARI